MSENMKHSVLSKRKDILSKVKDYINNHLNPARVNFWKFWKNLILLKKNLSALQISDDQDFQLHLKRPTDSCFVNNYFDVEHLASEANINIQPVFNYYKAITYMYSYQSMEEGEYLQDIKQAFKETLEKGASYHEQMKTIDHAYLSKMEHSLQEAVYHIMPEL